MLIVREVVTGDIPHLVALAGKAGYGLTSFVPDHDRLAQRVEDAQAGVAPLLVLEDRATGVILGTAGLWTHVGSAEKVEPFYTYRIEKEVMVSRALGVRTQVQTLHRVAEFDGPTEIGTLFLDPARRRGGVGRFLSLSRFLLLAQQPDRFDRHVIAELRGVVDEQGRSPFWDAVGRHFFHVEYTVADRMSSRDKTFIAELMPRHPIYLPLLPETVQAVVGQVHRETFAARRILESEGFYFARMVDIFDAGPVLRCDRDAIRTVRDSRQAVVAKIAPVASGGAPLLISRGLPPFRAVRDVVAIAGDEVTLSADAAQALQVDRGDAVRIVPFRSPTQATGSTTSTETVQ